MVILRATQKVLRLLQAPAETVGPSDTALGDWYVTRLVVDRQPLLLLVSSRSLLPLLVPARDVRTLPARLPDLVAVGLRRLGIPGSLIRAEVEAMDPVRIGPTRDRSIVGSMVDFAKGVPYYLPVEGWDATTLPVVESRLAETPCRAAGPADAVIFPERAAPELLAARWAATRKPAESQPQAGPR